MYTGPRTLGPSEECLTEGETWKQKNADNGLIRYRQIGSMDYMEKNIIMTIYPNKQNAINPINSIKNLNFCMILSDDNGPQLRAVD